MIEYTLHCPDLEALDGKTVSAPFLPPVGHGLSIYGHRLKVIFVVTPLSANDGGDDSVQSDFIAHTAQVSVVLAS